MATMHQTRAFTQTPELSLSDSEDSYSSSDEDMPDREETDQLLRQAHHYVITEGGKDSASLYIERIQRINRSLIHEISRHSYDCDPKLYRRVKQKVDHVLREFEDAVDPDYSIHHYDQMPEYYTTAAEDVLCRTGSSPVIPGGQNAQNYTKSGGDDDVQRTYLYGGSDSHPEVWHKNAPASLLFPETIRMAKWESLRIKWDITTTGDMESKKPVTSNGVSYNDPRLARFNCLSQFESGSRFNLPASDSAVEAKVNDFCTVAKLSKAVDAFSQNDKCRRLQGDFEYAPRVFLDNLEIGQQLSPTGRKPPRPALSAYALADQTTVADDVRKALNTTPTKHHRASVSFSRSGASRTADVEEYDRRSLVSSPPTSMSLRSLGPTVKPSSRRNSDTSAAVCDTKAATEASISTLTFPQSPSLLSETGQLSAAKRAGGRPGKKLLPASSDSRPLVYQTTAARKRKRLSVNVVDRGTLADTGVDTVPDKRARVTKEPARPYTPVATTQPDPLLTPVLTPALTIGSMSASSVHSTPPIAKARTAGRKQRKIRTKNDFEERVTPERYAKIMTQRNIRTQGHT
ncbi:hypothetical protein SVAN01_04041 [Stagonosporopsis vannaccii]|nr:hypothetical protein SVAN01_04041 [Stagonosporopsis vannaccii]